ncbi:hypothetical protein BBP40_005701 [Aspergillus hancockii]|nr:hypothetical protein BBP40_005701 [Aspergillus hancockii]
MPVHQLREVLLQTANRVADVEKGCLTFLLTESRGSDDVIEFKVIERWVDSVALGQHHERDWLQQMYQTFENEKLLDGTERIEHLTLISDIFLYGLIVPVLPFALKERLGLGDHHIQRWASAWLAVYGASILVGSLLFGWIGDHTKTRQGPFLLGLLVVGGATLLSALTTSLPLFLLARVLQGISTASVFTIGYSLLLDTTGSKHIGSALGFTSMSLSLGLFAGPIIGGFVYDIAGYLAVFAPAFALIILEIILCMLVDPPPSRYKPHTYTSGEESPLLDPRPEQPSSPALVILLQSPRFLVAMLAK